MASFFPSCSFSFLCSYQLSHSLTLSYVPCLQTLQFFIKLYARPGSWFSVTDSKTWLDLGFSLERNGLLQNFTDEKNQLMRDQVPWRGAHEKLSSFMQIIIESLTKEGDIVMDWQASTCVLLLFSYDFIF